MSVNVPDRIDTRTQWLGLHEDASRCCLEIEAQGWTEPAFHLLASEGNVIGSISLGASRTFRIKHNKT